MKNWLKQYHGWIMNVLAVAAPVAMGVVSGGVFTLPVLISAGGVIFGKLAQSWMPTPVPVAVSQAIDRANGK